MKFLIFVIALFTISAHAYSQNPDYSEKVASLDSTIYNLYNVISGPKGQARNWELFKYLFHKDAKLIPVGKSQDGKIIPNYITADGYIERSGSWLVENGFFEKEISRKTETYGNITHVFSTYESYYTLEDADPFMRGINSIQLLNDGQRWWIVNIYWLGESDENPLPEKYLK